MNLTDPFASVADGHTLAQAIVDTLREPLMVLDADLRVVAASRSFYETFRMRAAEVEGRFLYLLGDGQWDIPELRRLLVRILPEQAGMDRFEIEREFIGIGRRKMLLNARTVFFGADADKMILLAMEDVTALRSAEAAMKDLLAQKEILLQEMQHRVANSLQIIASILLLKARSVQSAETRQHLKDAHLRVMSVAAVQQQLSASRFGESVELGPYLTRLCESLAASMIADSRTIAVEVSAPVGEAQTSDAVSLGLIVTELLINAVKHAFPTPKADSRIRVAYLVEGEDWTLTVTDNGVGLEKAGDGAMPAGLGSSIVEALANKLAATVTTRWDENGTRITVQHRKADELLLVAAA